MSDHNFNTPPEILEHVRLLDVKGIRLDPCSNPKSMVELTAIHWTGPENGGTNGLSQSWRGRGLVFMNPPHSMSPHNIEPWMEKATDEFIYHPPQGDDQFVGLIPAKTDTGWFHEQAIWFEARCFLRGRPKFWLNGAPMPGPGKFASMLIYAGNNSDLFKEIFGPVGWIV